MFLAEVAFFCFTSTVFDYGIMILNYSVGDSGKSNSVFLNMHLLHRLLL